MSDKWYLRTPYRLAIHVVMISILLTMAWLCNYLSSKYDMTYMDYGTTTFGLFAGVAALASIRFWVMGGRPEGGEPG